MQVACGGGSSSASVAAQTGPIDTVTLTASKTSFSSFNETASLTATARDSTGIVVTNAVFTWTIADQTLLRIALENEPSGRATITAIGEGTTDVTVSAAGNNASVTLSIDQLLDRITISGELAVEFQGEMAPLVATGTDALGNVMTGLPFTWDSSAPGVASITQAGLVTAGDFGESTISALVDGVTGSAKFEVLGDRFFLNGDVRLRYELDLPDQNGGPFPAVVFVHGSGRADRNTQKHGSDPMLPQGLAVLRYDKRGVGESTGSFSNVGPENGDSALNLLASDAAAAVRFLQHFPQIDPLRRGIMANSQGGWIGPLAATQASEITFMLIWSGPTVSIGLEIFYSLLADGTSTPLNDVYAQLGSFTGPFGYTPMPVLSELDIPSLWLFGELDRSIPTRLDVANMQLLQAAGLPYEYILYPFAAHDLRDTRTGQFVGLWNDYGNWLRDRGILP